MPIRRTIFVFIFSFAVLVTSISSIRISAEETPIEKAQNDYAFQYTKYAAAKEKFITAKSAYLTFQTIASKNEALEKGKEYYAQIQNVYIAYLLLLKETGNAFTWTNNDIEKNKIFATLDVETNYFEENKPRISNFQTLEELNPFAESLRSRVEKTTLTKSNYALATYETVELEAALLNFEKLNGEVRSFTTNRVDENSLRAFFVNWDSEIERIRKSTDASAKKARALLSGTPFGSTENPALGQIRSTTSLGKEELKKTTPLFEEILRLI